MVCSFCFPLSALLDTARFSLAKELQDIKNSISLTAQPTASPAEKQHQTGKYPGTDET